MLNETWKSLFWDDEVGSGGGEDGGRSNNIILSNSLPTSTNNNGIIGGEPGGDGDDDTSVTTAINISENEWNSIRPYIDENELRALEPKARLHIILSALACNLDQKRQHQVDGGSSLMTDTGNYSVCPKKQGSMAMKNNVQIRQALAWSCCLVFFFTLLSLVSAQDKNVHTCKGVEIDMVEEHAMSVDECLALVNATSIKDVNPNDFACVGKCIMEKTGMVDTEGRPHKENIFQMVTDVLPPEVHDDLQLKFGKCLDEETADLDPKDESCTSYLPLCMCLHLAFLEECHSD